jgi:hypothetical protein
MNVPDYSKYITMCSLTNVKLESASVVYLHTIFSTVPHACKCVCILYSLLFHVPVNVRAYCVHYDQPHGLVVSVSDY